jgi:hypothetical protein
MEFCLKSNTVCIDIVNPISHDIVKKLVFFGDIPSKIKKIINTKSFTENEATLRDYFGKRWKEKLHIKNNTKTLRASLQARADRGVRQAVKTVHSGIAQTAVRAARVTGGDKGLTLIEDKQLVNRIKVLVSDEDLSHAWLDRLTDKYYWNSGDEKMFIAIEHLKDVPEVKELNKAIKKSSDYSVIDKHIGDAIFGVEQLPSEKYDGFDFDLENVQETVVEENTDTLKEVNYNDFVAYITDIILFPEDTFWTLKEKIYLATNIPVYRQYIYQHINDSERNIHKTVHSIFVSDSPYQIDTNNDTELFYGVRIDKNLYNNRENLRIKTKEPYKMIDSMMIDNIYLVDLQFYRENITNVNAILESNYNIDVLYYGLFKKYFPVFNREMMIKYLIDEYKALNEYPLINSNRSTLEKKYDIEKEIILDVYNKIDNYFDKFSDDIELSITEIVYRLLDQYSIQNGLFVRNMIDLFQCGDSYPFIECYTTKNNVKYRIVKYYKNQSEDSINKMLENKLYKITDEFSIYFWDKKYRQLNRFVINANGVYTVYAKYLRSDNVDFTDSLENIMIYVNAIIDILNYNSKMIFNPNYTMRNIPKFNQETTSVSSVKVNVKWNNIVTTQQFSKISDVLERLYKSGMASHRVLSTITPNIINIRMKKGITQQVNKFYLKKGVEVKDYYNVIYHDVKGNDIWNLRYGGKNINIENNLTNITFEFLNIADKEFVRVINYIMYVINYVSETKTLIKNTTSDVKKQSAMKKMKVLDPKLYNFSVQGTMKPVKYSRICQKKFRPVNIYNEEEYKLLSKEKQKKLHQFINYTTGDPVWYECPDSLPYLGFITNKHPSGFCIPKCKATETGGVKNKAIIEGCKNRFKFEKKVDTTGVLKFGKHLPDGKIGFLHEKIYEMMGIITGDNTAHLFMKGVPASYAGVPGSRILCCFAEQSRLSEIDIIMKLIEYISKSKNKELDDVLGVLNEMMKGEVDIAEDMSDIFVKLINEAFNVHFIYINTSVSIQNEILNSSNSDIYITMSNSCSEYIKLGQDINAVIFIRLHDSIYPVLQSVNSLSKTQNEGYASKNRKVKQTNDTSIITGEYSGIFNSDSNVIKALYSAISKKIMMPEKDLQNKIFSYISLKNYMTDKYVKYISDGQIKYLLTAKKTKPGICIGVSNSVNIPDVEEVHDVFVRNNFELPFLKLVSFLDHFKNVDPIVIVLKHNSFDDIDPNDEAIGLNVEGNYCWFNNTKLSKVLEYYKNAKCQIVTGEPSDVNMAITRRLAGKKRYLNNINETYYNMYIFKLLKYEIFKNILLWRDMTLRKFLIKEIGTKTFVDEMARLKIHSRSDYYKILNIIRNSNTVEKSLKEILLNHDVEMIIKNMKVKTDVDTFISNIMRNITIKIKNIDGDIGNTIISHIDYRNKEIIQTKHKEDLFYRNNRIKILEDKYDIMLKKIINDIKNELLFISEINNFNIFFIIEYFHFTNVPGSRIYIQPL